MVKLKSEGECLLCNAKFSKSMMIKHLQSCLQNTIVDQKVKTRNSTKQKCFHIVVEGGSVYWLHLNVSAEATLADLDEFLRDIWLECCGHISQFTIGETDYSSSPENDLFGDNDFFGDEDEDEKGMTVKLAKVLKPGMKISYEYDFGSTTELDLKVISEGEASIAKKDMIKILARNDAPEIRCMNCQEAPATQVCSQCLDEDGWLCEECVSEHECEEEMFLPVVNSPRVGVCGYEG